MRQKLFTKCFPCDNDCQGFHFHFLLGKPHKSMYCLITLVLETLASIHKNLSGWGCTDEKIVDPLKK